MTIQSSFLLLTVSLREWRGTNKVAVWLQIPMTMGQVIPVAAKYGFEYHHAERDIAVLCLWMRPNVPNKLPPYATHQVGVSGSSIACEILAPSVISISSVEVFLITRTPYIQ